jgi:DNA polymerase-3 subunit gamma/tau
VPIESIVKQLEIIAKGENLSVDANAMQLIARQANGGMRDAISLLDQLASTGEKITLELAQTVLGTATNETVLELIDGIRDNDPGAGLQAIHRSLDAGSDPRQLARQIVNYLRALMLFQMDNAAQVDATQSVKTRMSVHAVDFSSAAVLKMMRAFNAAATDQRGGWQPSLGLELALADVLEINVEAAPAPVVQQSAKPKQRGVAQAEVKRTQVPEPAPAKKTEASPKPDPPTSPFVLKNGSNIRSLTLSSIPVPLSLTERRTQGRLELPFPSEPRKRRKRSLSSNASPRERPLPANPWR